MTDQTSEKYVGEQELNDRAVAPRVTLDGIEANIAAEYYMNAGAGLGEGVPVHESVGLLTFCILVMRNGFVVVGQSACASPENYAEDIGRRVARGDAIRQVWPLMGYELRSKLEMVKALDGATDELGVSLTKMLAFSFGNGKAFTARDADRILGFVERAGGKAAVDAGEEGSSQTPSGGEEA